MSLSRLMSPLALGGREVKNRVCHVATVTNFGEHNRVTARLIDYYASRAAGGAGLIVSEGLVVHPTSVPQPAIVHLADPGNADGLKRWADAVEPHDCRLLGQLWHVGRQQLWNPVRSPWGVSDQPDALSWTVPHVMSRAEIGEVTEAFVAGARRLQDAGFSGVELHGAHGYLITQFLSPWSNTRDDEYGGDLEGRTRFLRQIMRGVRQACGEGFLMGLKMPAEEGVAGGIDLDEALRITRRLTAEAPLDYIAYSQGNFSLSLENHVPDMHWVPGPFLHLHREIKAAAPEVKVMALGRVVSAEHAERVLAEGGGDLVGMSRALVADPALPAKAGRDAAAAVRPCIFCNACWGEIHAGKPIACLLNTAVGQPDEVDPVPPRARRPRRVAVVGAGLAGLSAAATAAARGHEVTLLGASPEPGGAARLEALLPGRLETGKAVEWLQREARRHGAAFRLGERATADTVAGLGAEAVVLATGSRLRPPALAGGSEPLADLRSAAVGLLAAEVPARAGTAVVFDQDHSAPVYAAVELLTHHFRRVLLLTPRTQLARGVPYVSAIGVYRRLYAAGVEIVPAAAPHALRDGRLEWRNVFTGSADAVEGVRLAAYATPRVAEDGLAAALREAVPEVRLAGDCYSPRTPLAAIHEGHAVALQL